MHARNLMLRTLKSMVVIPETGCIVTWPKRHEDRQKSRESRNAEIGRTSVGTRVVVGDMVLVKEAESLMAREGIHHKLAHEHWTSRA